MVGVGDIQNCRNIVNYVGLWGEEKEGRSKRGEGRWIESDKLWLEEVDL